MLVTGSLVAHRGTIIDMRNGSILPANLHLQFAVCKSIGAWFKSIARTMLVIATTSHGSRQILHVLTKALSVRSRAGAKGDSRDKNKNTHKDSFVGLATQLYALRVKKQLKELRN